MSKSIENTGAYQEIDEHYRRKLFFGIDFYEFQERAAIIQFDGKIKAEVAVGLAFIEITKNYAYSNGKIK